MNPRITRLLRGYCAAVIATAMAAVAHVLGGGENPHPLLLLFCLAISAMICVALASRTLSLLRLSMGVLSAQGIFHLLFSVTGCGSSTAVSAGSAGASDSTVSSGGNAVSSGGNAVSSGGHAGHFGQAELAAQGLAGSTGDVSSTASAASASSHMSLAMLIFHVSAALVTIVLLRRGELAAVKLGQLFTLRLSYLFTPLQPLIVPRARSIVQAVAILVFVQKFLLSALRFRGPPQLCPVVYAK